MLGFNLLSKREAEVIELASRGKLDKEITAELGVSIHTLRTYWTRIRNKVGDHSRSALVVAWIRGGQDASSNLTVEGQPFYHRWKLDLTRDSFFAEESFFNDFEIPKGQSPKATALWCMAHPEDRDKLRNSITLAIQNGEQYFSCIHRSFLNGAEVLEHSFGSITRGNSGAARLIDGHTVRVIEPYQARAS